MKEVSHEERTDDEYPLGGRAPFSAGEADGVAERTSCVEEADRQVREVICFARLKIESRRFAPSAERRTSGS